MTVAWLPYDSPAEAAKRLGGIPEGIEVECFTGEGPPPTSTDRVAFLVIPHLRGPEVLADVAQMTSLQVVQTLTAGVERYRPRVPEHVTLCNAAGVHDAGTAELAVALALVSGRRLDTFARNMPAGEWDPQFGTSVADQRVLIIGYGHIGAAIERRLAGFDVATVTRVARRARTGPPEVHPIEDLHALLPSGDIVFLVAPHTPATEGLIGAAELALLPDDAVLVNVARGRLVDTDALVEATAAGRVRAALDVTEPEPLPPEHPLWRTPGVYLTPHVGGASSAFFPRADRLVASQLRRFAEGRELENVIR